MKYKIPKKQKGGFLLKENNSSDPIYEGGMIPAAVSSYKYTMKDYDNLASKKNLNEVPSVLQSGVMKARVRGAINKGVKDVLLPILAVPAAATMGAGIVSSAVTAPLATAGGFAGGVAGQVATDKATSVISKGKYPTWGSFVSNKTGINPIVAEFTNPGAWVGGIAGGVLGSKINPQILKSSSPIFIQTKESMTRGIGSGKAGLNDLFESGIVRANPKGRLTNPHQFAKKIKNLQRNGFSEKEIEELASNNISKNTFNKLKQFESSSNVKSENIGGINIKKKSLLGNYETYDDYLNRPSAINYSNAFWYESGAFPNYSNYPSDYFVRLNNKFKYKPYVPDGHMHPTTSEQISLNNPDLQLFKTIKIPVISKKVGIRIGKQSALGNNGKFDTNDPNIYKSISKQPDVSPRRFDLEVKNNSEFHDEKSIMDLATKAKAYLKEEINNPVKVKTDWLNYNLSKRLNLSTPVVFDNNGNKVFLSLNEYKNLNLRRPVDISFSTKLDHNVGATYHHEPRASKITINWMTFAHKENSDRLFNNLVHEFGHHARIGNSKIEDLKATKLLKPYSELKKSHNTIKMNTTNGEEPYLTLPGETSQNIRDLSMDLGLKIGQSYPGKEALSKMLRNYNGRKSFIINDLKLDTPRDYKRVWDALTGKYFTIGAGLTGGINQIKEKKKGGKLILRKRK